MTTTSTEFLSSTIKIIIGLLILLIQFVAISIIIIILCAIRQYNKIQLLRYVCY